MQPQPEFITKTEKVPCLAHLAIRAQGDLLRCTDTKRKSSPDPKNIQETHSARERIFAEDQEVRDCRELRADKAAEGEEAASARLSEVEHHTRSFLEGQRNQILSDARSEMSLQELKTECADMAFRE